MTVSFEKYYQIFFFQLISQSFKCEIFLYIKGLFKKKKFILPKKRNQVRTRTVFRQCIQRGPKEQFLDSAFKEALKHQRLYICKVILQAE